MLAPQVKCPKTRARARFQGRPTASVMCVTGVFGDSASERDVSNEPSERGRKKERIEGGMIERGEIEFSKIAEGP